MITSIDFIVREQSNDMLKIECSSTAFHHREESFNINNIKKSELFDLMRSLSLLTIEKYNAIARFTVLFNF